MTKRIFLTAFGLDSLLQAHSKKELSEVRLESETRSGEYRRGRL